MAAKKTEEEKQAYAIVRDGPHQTRVEKGGVIRLAYRGELEAGTKVTIGDVLLYADGDGVQVGAPLLKGAKVTATVRGTVKGPKLIIYRYLKRKNSDKKRGHRQKYTEAVVDSISLK